MNHIDLFSGIGGFALAADWAGFETEVFCEKEPFCREILAAHWPGTPIVKDIREFDGRKHRGATVLSGGFPCQPFSAAGKRKGEGDDRHLWPEMRRVISEARPAWIIGENVPGIISMGLDNVLSDLENEGYETGTFIIPACAVGAPHRRSRVWITAHDGRNSTSSRWNDANEIREIGAKKGLTGFSTRYRHAPDAEGNPERAGLCEGGPAGERRRRPPDLWGEAWPAVATRLCRVDDGLSIELDGALGIPAIPPPKPTPQKTSAGQAHRLKALGNAIVPQVAFEFFKAIAEIEKRR